jgi:hypothetical protein
MQIYTFIYTKNLKKLGLKETVKSFAIERKIIYSTNIICIHVITHGIILLVIIIYISYQCKMYASNITFNCSTIVSIPICNCAEEDLYKIETYTPSIFIASQDQLINYPKNWLCFLSTF